MPHNPESKNTLIIDRTLPEIYQYQSKMSRLDILEFARILKSTGVDIIEINRALMQKIGKLPKGLDYIFRVHSIADIDTCVSGSIRQCVLRKSVLLLPGIADSISVSGLDATLEVNINTLEGIHNLKGLKCMKSLKAVSCLRIAGLGNITSAVWVNAVEQIKSLLAVKLDICPGNRFSLGTAAALEAVEHEMDFVTAAFAGYGREYAFTPLEELLVSMRILLNKNTKSDLAVLPELSRRFKKYTHREIPGGKAVIGKDIFKYESGIHAYGIEKDPNTYEPYDPSLVGQRRDMTIGKHSGRQSVRKKLIELGLEAGSCDLEDMLEHIREKSILSGRSLNDEEVLSLYYDIMGYMANA